MKKIFFILLLLSLQLWGNDETHFRISPFFPELSVSSGPFYSTFRSGGELELQGAYTFDLELPFQWSQNTRILLYPSFSYLLIFPNDHPHSIGIGVPIEFLVDDHYYTIENRYIYTPSSSLNSYRLRIGRTLGWFPIWGIEIFWNHNRNEDRFGISLRYRLLRNILLRNSSF